jgi:hypothetical protein
MTLHRILLGIEKIISIIQQLYDGFSCQVIHDGNLTEPFTVPTGVRQGYILPPLFLMVIDWVRKTAYKEPKGIQWILRRCCFSPCFRAVEKDRFYIRIEEP